MPLKKKSPKRYKIKENIINMLIVGVGGQGVVLAADIVSLAFVKAGYDVKMSASYGMAQRGGSVVAHIRIGKKIYSPLVARGEADIIMAMELREGYRYAEYLRKSGLIMLLDNGSELLKGEIRKTCRRVLEISYKEIMRDFKNIKPANVFMLGALSNYFSIKKRYWVEAIKEKVPLHFRDLNLSAFEKGKKKFSLGLLCS